MLNAKSKKLVKTLFKMSLTESRVDEKKVRVVLQALEGSRTTSIYSVLKAYQHLLMAQLARSLALVESAVEIPSAEKDEIETKLKQDFSKSLSFDYAVNKDILGGIRITVGDNLIDYSLSRKFDQLKERNA